MKNHNRRKESETCLMHITHMDRATEQNTWNREEERTMKKEKERENREHSSERRAESSWPGP